MSKSKVIPGLDEVLRREVYAQCFGALDREVGGVLVGSPRRGGPPRVAAAIPALRASENPGQLTFTQDAWAEIHRELEAKYPDEKIIGWYHTHPGYGLFLSKQDLFIHTNFFKDRSQIAVVVDPIAREEAVFAWAGGEIREYYRRPTTYDVPAGSGGSTRRPTVSETRSALAPERPTLGPESRQPAPVDRRPETAPFTGFRSPPLTTWIYLMIIGLAAGTILWELLLK